MSKHKAGALLINVFLLLLCAAALAELEVHFLDVGEADAAILICDGEVLMIDGGNAGDSRFIYSYLKNTLGISHIDFMIATHPHEDHVGGLSAAFNACAVGTVYSSVTSYDSEPFQNLLKYAAKQELSIIVPNYLDRFMVGSAQVTFLSQPQEGWSVNDSSLVVRVDYGEKSFLFTGDIENEAEYDMIQRQADIHADVLKVAHHGSDTSSMPLFIQRVAPSYAVISVGKNNDYGHPKNATLRILSQVYASVFRTDKHGSIIFTTDGHELQLKTQNIVREY